MKKIVAVFVLLLLTAVQTLIFQGGGIEQDILSDEPLDVQPYIREDSGTMAIGNDGFEIVLNKDVNGGITKIIDKGTGIDLRENKVPPPVLLMIMYWTGSETDIVIQWDADSADFSNETGPGYARITIDYHEFRGKNLNATVTIEMNDHSNTASFGLEIENDEDFILRSVFFPVVWGLGKIGGSAEDDMAFYPLGDGIVVKNPLKYPNELHMTEMYPSTASMQVMCHYDPDETGLYMAANDDQGYPKKPSLDWMEWSAERHFTAFFEHPIPEYAGNDYTMDYSCLIGSFHGDWYDAAEIYQSWALTTDFVSAGKVFEDKDTPEWFSKTSVVSSSNRDADLVHNPLSRIENMTEEFNELTGVNTTHLIFAWAQNGAWCGPYYFPPAAGEDNFTNSMNNITDDGGHPFLYISGSVWRITRGDIGYEDYELFNDIGAQWVCIDQYGNPIIDAGYLILNWTSARMCPMTDFWHQMVVNNTLDCLRLGVDVVQIDEFPIGSIYPCYNASHGHPLGYSKDITAAYRSIINDSRTEGRKINPDFLLSMEEPCEFYIPFMDTYASRDNAPEFLLYPFAIEQFGNDVEFVPFFSHVYHEYITAFAEPIPMNYNYPELFINQMKRSLARACVSGEVISGSADVKENLRPEVRQFYNTTVRASAIYCNDYLIKGKPLRPPEIDVPNTTVDWLFYSTQTLGRPFDERSVLHSAWEADDGDIGHVFINWIDTSIEFDVELPEYDLDDGEYSIIITRNGVKETLLRRTELPVTIHLETNPSEVILIEITRTPDLTMGQIGIHLRDGPLLINDTYHIETSVENTGTEGSGPFEVHQYMNDTLIRSWSMSSLDAGMEMNIDLEWNTTGFLGEYNHTFVVDPDNEIDELDETNNTAWGIVNIFNRPRSSLTVRVINGSSKMPIPFAEVHLESFDSDLNYTEHTNSTGLAFFDNVPAGQYIYYGHHPQFNDGSNFIIIDEGQHYKEEISLVIIIKRHRINVTVLDNETGNTLFSSYLELYDIENNSTMIKYEIPSPGVCSFTNIFEGNYILRIFNEGYYGQNISLILDGSELFIDITVRLVPLPLVIGSLFGYVHDNTSGDLLRYAEFNFDPGNYVVAWSREGSFMVVEMTPGDYSLEVTMENYSPWYGNVTVEAGKTTYLDIYLERMIIPEPEPEKKLAIIKGNVTDENGNAISEAYIDIIGLTLSTLTNENGSFFFKDLYPGTYHLYIVKDGYEEKEITVTMDYDDVVDLVIVIEEEKETNGHPNFLLFMIIAIVVLAIILFPIIVYKRAAAAAEYEE